MKNLILIINYITGFILFQGVIYIGCSIANGTNNYFKFSENTHCLLGFEFVISSFLCVIFLLSDYDYKRK